MNEDSRKNGVVGGAIDIAGVGLIGYGGVRGVDAAMNSKRATEIMNNDVKNGKRGFVGSAINGYQNKSSQFKNWKNTTFSKNDAKVAENVSNGGSKQGTKSGSTTAKAETAASATAPATTSPKAEQLLLNPPNEAYLLNPPKMTNGQRRNAIPEGGYINNKHVERVSTRQKIVNGKPKGNIQKILKTTKL